MRPQFTNPLANPRGRLAGPLLLLVACSSGTASDAAGPDADLSFERDVRPILKANCFRCHGEGEVAESGLDVRLRRLIVAGGESGPAIEPRRAKDSLLFERIKHGDMPPEDVEKRPTSAEVALIGRWIDAGARTARPEPETIDWDRYITEEERGYWAFQPVRPEPPPNVRRMDLVRSPIDQFLLARLEERGLSFSAAADKTTLLRRAYFDLVGLPPPPDEAREFLADDAADAYQRLIDRLLSSPHYGERWGRHWLDVAGYADSEGYSDEDTVRPDAWKYRDYVIRSLCADKPFDQFIREQLAGDEMVSPPYSNLPPADVDKLIATGFLRMAPDGSGIGGVDHGVARNQSIADTIQIVSTSLLGLTVACAQCHNHRYDPIPQADYYRLRAIFEPALDWKNWRTPARRRVSLYTDADRQRAAEIEAEAKKIEAQRKQKETQYIQQVFDRELAKLPNQLHDPIRAARDTPAKKRTAEQKKLLKEHPSVNVSAGSLYLYDKKAAGDLKRLAEQAAQIRKSKPKQEFVRALTEPLDKSPPKTFLFDRGDHEQPKDELQPGELTVLVSSDQADFAPNDPSLPTTGRRLAYARRLTSGNHPLTARVIVNRVWMHHFGRGIVNTPGDFGLLGNRPSHPKLLDWLAGEFVRQGWSLKRLHRMIMNSTVYRQTSRRDPAQQAVDADNRFLGRMPVRRLEAEVLRDSVLAIGDRLNRQPYGPAIPVMADRVGQFVIGIENLNAGRPGPVIPMRGEEFRRSVYVQVRRSRPLSVTAAFDAPRMEPNCSARSTSTVAPQSLMLMNSQFVLNHAENFARRVRDEAGSERASQIRRAWQLAFARPPEADELAEMLSFLAEQERYFQSAKKPNSKQQETTDAALEALAGLCHAMLSSNEFLYVD